MNPFNPGAGTQPPELSGRDKVLGDAEVAISRVLAGRSAQGQILVGLRGVGKTVLLNRIWAQANQLGANAVLIEANEKRSLPSLLLPELRRILISLDLRASASDKVKKGMRVFRSFTSGLRLKHGEFEFEFGNVEPERGSADSGDLEVDLAELFVAVAEAAQDHKTSIVLCIDELQNISEVEFGALIMAVHKTTQRSLPLLLIGAGLPQIIALAGKSKSYAERLFLYPEIGPLRDEDARQALEKPVIQENASFSSDALDLILEQTQGYPYFLQEWGKEAWNTAVGPTIQAEDIRRANPLILRNLDQNFFRMRFSRLTPSEQRYLRELAELGPGPQRSGDIARKLGVSTRKVGPRRDALVKKGMIYSPAHGDVAFTVPLFDEFMKRVMPDQVQS